MTTFRLLSALLLLLAATALPATAQPVYRCESPGGTATFQDRACASGDAGGAYVVRVTPGGATPPGVLAEMQSVAQKHAVPARATPARSRGRTTTRTGYKCTAGRRVFYQYQPCPARAPETPVPPGGRRSKKQPRDADVRLFATTQQEIGAEAACKGLDAERHPYERNTKPKECR